MTTQETLLPKSNKTKIIKEGSVQVQYGVRGCIRDSEIVATEHDLFITDKNDEQSTNLAATSVSIEWTKLVNIDDLNDKNNIHSFQLLFQDKLYSSIYIYCDSKWKKRSWIKVFEKMCPRFILTKELKTLKTCAINLGFAESQIESALSKYHQEHGTVYNVDVFVGIIMDEINSKNNDEEKELDKELECAICTKIYRNPVKNIYNKTYCFDCIKSWFEMIREKEEELLDEYNPLGQNMQNDTQTKIRDPLTNQTLPQNCRLLIPVFSKMVEIWNRDRTQNEQVSVDTYNQLKGVDQRLNMRRKYILDYLTKTENCEKIATEMLDAMIKSNKFGYDKDNLEGVLNEAFQCQKCFKEIKDLIDEGTKIYNNAIMRIVDNHNQSNCLFKWQEPDWQKYCKPDKQLNWAELYQVEYCVCSEIDDHTTNVVSVISEILQNQQLSIKELKDEILNIILEKQKEIMTKVIEEKNNEEVEEAEEMKTDTKQIKYIQKMKRIMYKENHGLVNTECVREIAECIKANEPFELYHNDLGHKTMNRDQMVRYLQTAGIDGIEYQNYVYECFANDLKQKLLNISSFLQSIDDKKFDYFPYFKHLAMVQVVDQQIIDPKDWSKENDKIELKIKFNCDYDDNLSKYNGDKRALGNEIKRQMLKHLKLEGAKQYIAIEQIEKGSIWAKVIFGIPFSTILASSLAIGGGLALCGGLYDFYCCLKKHKSNPNFFVPWYRSMLQGAMVGSGIGSVVAAGCVFAGKIAAATTWTIGGCITLGPIGIIAGCVVAGAVFFAGLGFGLWKYLNYKKEQRQLIELNIDNEIEQKQQENKPQQQQQPQLLPEPIYLPPPQQPRADNGGGWDYQISGQYVQELRDRMEQNGKKFKLKLDCDHEMEYDPEIDQTEGNVIQCRRCGESSNITKFKRIIQNDENGTIADWSIRSTPSNQQYPF